MERKLKEPHAYVTNLINPCTWLMVWQWHHFLLDMTLNWKLSHKFLSVVNFQVTSKQNHTKRHLVKQDLPVLKNTVSPTNPVLLSILKVFTNYLGPCLRPPYTMIVTIQNQLCAKCLPSYCSTSQTLHAFNSIWLVWCVTA